MLRVLQQVRSSSKPYAQQPLRSHAPVPRWLLDFGRSEGGGGARGLWKRAPELLSRSLLGASEVSDCHRNVDQSTNPTEGISRASHPIVVRCTSRAKQSKNFVPSFLSASTDLYISSANRSLIQSPLNPILLSGNYVYRPSDVRCGSAPVLLRIRPPGQYPALDRP
jgi:hypothetical protein